MSKRLCCDTAEDTAVNDEMECSVFETKDHMYALCMDNNTSSGNNCPICYTLCKDEDELGTFNERSIGCDGCNALFHFRCLKITQKKLKEIGESNSIGTVHYVLKIDRDKVMIYN